MKACGSNLSAVFSQADPAGRPLLVSVSVTTTSAAGTPNVSLGENPVFWFYGMIELKDFNSDMSSYVPGACSVSVHYNRAAFCCLAHFLLSKNTGNLKSKIWSSIKPLNVLLFCCFYRLHSCNHVVFWSHTHSGRPVAKQILQGPLMLPNFPGGHSQLIFKSLNLYAGCPQLQNRSLWPLFWFKILLWR